MIKSLVDQVQAQEASPVSEQLWQEMSQLDRETMQKLAELRRKYVNFNGATFKEFGLMIFFAGEGLTPTWLGGDVLPELVGKAKEAQRTQEIAQPVVEQKPAEKPDWAKFLNV